MAPRGEFSNASVLIILVLPPLRTELQRLASRHRNRPEQFLKAAEKAVRVQLSRLKRNPNRYISALVTVIRGQLAQPGFARPKPIQGTPPKPQPAIEDRKVPAVLRALELIKAPLTGAQLSENAGREWLSIQKTIMASRPGRRHLQQYVRGAELKQQGMKAHEICLRLLPKVQRNEWC
jgi:hypothetical protein